MEYNIEMLNDVKYSKLPEAMTVAGSITENMTSTEIRSIRAEVSSLVNETERMRIDYQKALVSEYDRRFSEAFSPKELRSVLASVDKQLNNKIAEEKAARREAVRVLYEGLVAEESEDIVMSIHSVDYFANTKQSLSTIERNVLGEIEEAKDKLFINEVEEEPEVVIEEWSPKDVTIVMNSKSGAIALRRFVNGRDDLTVK